MGLIKILPRSLHPCLSENFEVGLEEIRIRAGQETELIYGNGLSIRLKKVSEDEIMEMLNYLSDYSPYMLEEQLKQGFFTIAGGHRIGITGRANRTLTVSHEDVVKNIADIGAFNVRVAHEIKGCADELYSHLWDEGRFTNTFLLAEPGMGKTTFLRDLIRGISTGDGIHKGMKVCVVDERSEIAACYQGIPQNDLGPSVDVLDNCPKVKGMQMLLRTMSPQVIAVDELGGKEEFEAVMEILYSGCFLVGTIHAGNVDELKSKPFMREMIESGDIKRFAEIKRDERGSRYVVIFDERFQRIC